MAEGAGSFFDLLRGSIPAPGSGLLPATGAPQLPIIGGSALVPDNPVLEAQRLDVLRRTLPGGRAIPLPPIQTSRALVPGGGIQMPPVAPQMMNPRLEALRRLAQLLNLAEAGPAMAMLPVAIADDATNYARVKYTGPSGGMTAPMNPYASTNNRVSGNRAVPQQVEPVQGISYSDYAEGEKNKFGITALGGTQGLPTKGKASQVVAPRTQSSNRVSNNVNAPVVSATKTTAPQQSQNAQTSTSGQTRPQQGSVAKPSATQAQPPKQGSAATPAPTQSSNRPSQTQTAKPSATQTGSPVKSQTANPPTAQKSALVVKAEPSGEALSYFRKNKTSPGWDALGTAVSLVQTSLTPEKGGLKSRTEYDRLLRGSDNFKKLDGNEQQRVRQAFAQWMNEQTMFKGKA